MSSRRSTALGRSTATCGASRCSPRCAPTRPSFARSSTDLRPRVSLRRCEPGEVIFRQGAPAVDGLYLVRTGFVKVSQARPGGERVLNYVGPGGYIGEIGLLSDLPELRDLAPAGVRTATCTALDHVDLVRITPDDFRGDPRAISGRARRRDRRGPQAARSQPRDHAKTSGRRRSTTSWIRA